MEEDHIVGKQINYIVEFLFRIGEDAAFMAMCPGLANEAMRLADACDPNHGADPRSPKVNA